MPCTLWVKRSPVCPRRQGVTHVPSLCAHTIPCIRTPSPCAHGVIHRIMNVHTRRALAASSSPF
jgi:hypothetical protein